MSKEGVVAVMEDADDRAREALKAYGRWDAIPAKNGTAYQLRNRARAIQAEDELKALHTRLSNETGNPVTVYEEERESLLNKITDLDHVLTQVRTEYDRMRKDYDALRERVAEYQDMPDPQETRRRMDALAQEIRHLQENLTASQRKVTELLDEKHRSEDLIQNLKRDLGKSGRYTDEQVLELLMPLARRVHGLESKLFEQAGMFP